MKLNNYMHKRQDFKLMILDVRQIQLELLKIQLKKITEIQLPNLLDNNFKLIKKLTDKNVL